VKNRNQQNTLLEELERCRWITMLLLADEAEENGDAAEAKGWRWMSKQQRWPTTSPYSGISRWAFSNYWRRSYYGSNWLPCSEATHKCLASSKSFARLIKAGAQYVGKMIESGELQDD
jgi:hypothetical protein